MDRFGPVPGGQDRAICIARRESGLDPTATSSPTGEYRGLFQHDRDLWPARYDRYTEPAWELSRTRPQRADERHRDDPDGLRHRDVARGGLAAQGVLSGRNARP